MATHQCSGARACSGGSSSRGSSFRLYFTAHLPELINKFSQHATQVKRRPAAVFVRRVITRPGNGKACLFAPASARAQNAYITNSRDNTVSVIDTATNTVVGSPILVGSGPQGVAVTPDGSKVYVTNFNDDTVSVIATATNTVATIPVGSFPAGVAVTPDGSKVYVANQFANNVSVIDTATNTVVGFPISVGIHPLGVAVTPDGSNVYVVNFNANTVSVIDTATNTVEVAVSVGN